MLSETIPSYLYTQYADDDDLQAFVSAYNQAAQTYVNWFNTVSLPYYPGLSGPLLDWVATGLYGLSRTSLVQSTGETGPFNTQAFNTAAFNTGFPAVANYYTLSDDFFKRILTWDFYKGDGKHFTMSWLKRRIMRFLAGTNGIDPQPGNTDFVVGVENTTAISTQVTNVSGVLTLTVRINQTQLSNLFQLQPNILTLFKLAFLGGCLELPIQYSYVLVIEALLTVSISPMALVQIGSSVMQTTAPAFANVSGGSGPYIYAWTWLTGGIGITINTPSASSTTFSASGSASGVALLTVTDYYSSIASATVSVTINNSSSGPLSNLALNEIVLNT